MDYKIRWSPRAAENLDLICTYIAKDSSYYASLTATKILKLIDNLSLFPESGRIVPEYNSHYIREIIYKNFRIVYRLKEGIVEIVTICHSARKELSL